MAGATRRGIFNISGRKGESLLWPEVEINVQMPTGSIPVSRNFSGGGKEMFNAIKRIRWWLVCKKEGLVAMYCPVCGKHIADTVPGLTGTFMCGLCGTEWTVGNLTEEQENEGSE